VEIRPATIADALAVATVHVRSWQAAYPGLLPQDYLDDLDPQRSLGQWETVLDATVWPTTGTLVVTDAETITGFASIGPTRDEDDDPTTVGELQTLYLDPDVWNTGRGSALLQAVQDQFVTARFLSASAWVLEPNRRARLFYERHGWRFDGTTKQHDWVAFVATDVRYRVLLT
jgi:GNAT superfamily N-acetyltransferase